MKNSPTRKARPVDVSGSNGRPAGLAHVAGDGLTQLRRADHGVDKPPGPLSASNVGNNGSKRFTGAETEVPLDRVGFTLITQRIHFSKRNCCAIGLQSLLL